ncbi:MAG: FIVAR domain-containing protein [Coprococcus sp.]
MSKKKELMNKTLVGLIVASMTAGFCPTTAFAVTGGQVAEDGVYTKTATVARTQEDEDDENEWNEYDVTVSLKVEDGIFADITVTTSDDYDAENDSYFNKAVNKSKGFQTLLIGQAATEDTINGWDSVSGATRTSDAVKSAALDAIHEAEEAVSEETVVQYVTMNVPYTDFYAAYSLTDKAVWEVEEGIDAVSTATTSKFKSTDSLAKGTYNDGKYIMGVTLPVKVSAEDYSKLNTNLTENDNYYFTVLEGTPSAYSEMTIHEDGSYSFSRIQQASISTADLSVSDVELDGGYGDYQVSLLGVSPGGDLQTGTDSVGSTVYGAILKTADGGQYGMTALENLWFGTRVENMEIAWSVIGGQGLCRAHGAGDEFYQFDMNGAVLNGITLITSIGLVDIACNIELPEYYTGDLSQLAYSIANDSKELSISGIPEDLEDVRISVSGGLADNAEVVDGKVALNNFPEDGTKYTLTISSSNYPDITRTMSTPISETQKDELRALIVKAEATEGYADNADLQEHVSEAREMIDSTDATSVDAANLIDELEEKIKKTYPSAEATATLKGSELAITLDVALNVLENPSYTLSYKQGRSSVVLTSGALTALNITLDTAPTAGTEYTLTIVSDNYQDIVTTVTAEADDVDDYILMNIPYAAFYAADVNNDVEVDAFSSATLNKTRTASLAGGSYHVNSDGSDITGITFPVKVGEGVDLSNYRQVTDEDSVTISVTNRGQTSETTYTGKDALFESASYSYYVLDEVPAFYKELIADEEGNLSFGEVIGEVQAVSGVTAELYTESSYGDYELVLDGFDLIDTSTDQIYGVVISTKEGSDYGLRHLENIWRVTDLAWCTGFTEAVHGCPTSSAHYEAMMGQTIHQVTYYTSKGIYEIPLEDIYVPVKFEHTFTVADAAVTAGSTKITLVGLPNDYQPEYSVKGLETSVSGDVLTFRNAEKGSYTLTVSDQSGKYAELYADFILYTEDMPAAYNEDGSAPALVVAEGYTAEQFNEYISSISAVTVNGETYAASGHGSVVIINEDGTLKTDAAPFAEGDTFEITVSSTGYLELTFIYTTKAVPGAGEIDTSALQAVIEKAEALKESDYTSESWDKLQSTLTEAKAILEAKESQTNVDIAVRALQAAIDNLEPADKTTTGSKNNSTTAVSQKNGTTPKTGDPMNVWGLMTVALSSAGLGGLGLKLRKKSKEEDEEV